MPVIQSKKNWPLENQESRMKKGKLVRVEISPGRFIKMHEADLSENKLAVSDANKIDKSGASNKAASDAAGDPPIEADDLSSISGVGKASERVLNDHDFYTFKDLAAAGELAFLTPKVNEKIQAWRDEWSADLSE